MENDNSSSSNDDMINDLYIMQQQIKNLNDDFIMKYPDAVNINNIINSFIDSIKYQIELNCHHEYQEDYIDINPDKS